MIETKPSNIGAIETTQTDFIRQIISEDNASGKFQGRVHTRFPLSRTAIYISGMPNQLF